jgi:hypothetical protein
MLTKFFVVLCLLVPMEFTQQIRDEPDGVGGRSCRRGWGARHRRRSGLAVRPVQDLDPSRGNREQC